MQKYCINCRNAFWGGQYCPNCFGGGNVELLDLALPENQKYIPEMKIDVRPKYFARTAMMLTLFGSVIALPIGMFVFIRGMSSSDNIKFWGGLALGTVFVIAFSSWKMAGWLFEKQMKDVSEDKDAQYD